MKARNTVNLDQTIIFNRFSLWSIIILLFLPTIAFFPNTPFESYLDAFDKLSLPLWAALYSALWLMFHEEIKKLNKIIPLFEKRVDSYNRIVKKVYINEIKTNNETLSNLYLKLAESKENYDFINVTLRFTIIITAVVKIGQTFYSII